MSDTILADVRSRPAATGGVPAAGAPTQWVGATITLTLKEPPSVPLEAEVISPDVTAGLGHADIRALPVFLGKRQRRLDDFFTVEGVASDAIEIRGDAAKVKWVGRG